MKTVFAGAPAGPGTVVDVWRLPDGRVALSVSAGADAGSSVRVTASLTTDFASLLIDALSRAVAGEQMSEGKP